MSFVAQLALLFAVTAAAALLFALAGAGLGVVLTAAQVGFATALVALLLLGP